MDTTPGRSSCLTARGETSGAQTPSAVCLRTWLGPCRQLVRVRHSPAYSRSPESHTRDPLTSSGAPRRQSSRESREPSLSAAPPLRRRPAGRRAVDNSGGPRKLPRAQFRSRRRRKQRAAWTHCSSPYLPQGSPACIEGQMEQVFWWSASVSPRRSVCSFRSDVCWIRHDHRREETVNPLDTLPSDSPPRHNGARPALDGGRRRPSGLLRDARPWEVSCGPLLWTPGPAQINRCAFNRGWQFDC